MAGINFFILLRVSFLIREEWILRLKLYHAGIQILWLDHSVSVVINQIVVNLVQIHILIKCALVVLFIISLIVLIPTVSDILVVSAVICAILLFLNVVCFVCDVASTA